MLHYEVFHLGLHCWPKYPFMGFGFSNGLLNKKIIHCLALQPGHIFLLYLKLSYVVFYLLINVKMLAF